MGFASLAEVLSGWTGTIAVTYGGITTTITPYVRESVASLWARTIAQVYADSGLTMTISTSGSDTTITTSASCTITLTGNTATRTDYDSGPYTNTSFPSDGNGYLGRYVPTRGLRLDGPAWSVELGRSTSTGSAGFAGPMIGGTATLTMWSSFADTWANEDLEGVYDVWHDGRIFGRGRIDSIRRERMGRLSDQVVMRADFHGCTE